MTEDALGDILKREGVTDFIESEKEQLRNVVLSLIDAYKQLFPGGPIRLKILGPLIWDVVRWENKIHNVFILHSSFDMKELEAYGGPVSERIVDDILKMLEVDLGDIKLRRIK